MGVDKLQTYILLILATFMSLLWYSASRGNRSSSLNKKLPEKYLIKNKVILAYLGKPKDRVTKFTFSLHLVHMILLIGVIILYIIFWAGGISYSFLNSYLIYCIYISISMLFTFPIMIFNLVVVKKYKIDSV